MITTKCSICGKEINLAAKWKGFDEKKIICPNHTNKEIIGHNMLRWDKIKVER
jgi:hypothetical protein